MKHTESEYKFSVQKNQWLIKERNISFEEVISALREADQLLEVIDHPNQGKYPNQKMYVVKINEYVCLVPFVRQGNEVFLKTIFPSRKAHKKYSGESYHGT